MAKFWMINSVSLAGLRFRSGTSVDDTRDPYTSIVAVGGFLWPQGTPSVDAAATAAQAARARGLNDEEVADIMSAAVDAIDLTGTPAMVPSGVALDWLVSKNYNVTITTNTTFSFANTLDGRKLVVAVHATGSDSVTWPAGIKWPAGSPPTQTASGTDIYTFLDIGGTIFGTVSQAFA